LISICTGEFIIGQMRSPSLNYSLTIRARGEEVPEGGAGMAAGQVQPDALDFLADPATDVE